MAVRKDNIEVTLDISPAPKGVKEFQVMLDQYKQLNNEMRKMKRAGKENTKEFAALKKKADDLNKSFEKFDLSTARIGQLEKRSKDLARAIRFQLTPGTKEFIRSTKELKKVNKRLADVRKEAGLTNQAMQEVRIMGFKLPDGLVKGIGGIQTAFKAFLALQVVQYFIELFSVVDQATQEFLKLRGTIRDLTGAAGQELDNFTVRVAAIGKTFQQEQDEILRATNAVAKQMGIDFDEALDVVETGFLAGVNSSGELLDMLHEYPAFFKEAGLSANQMLSVLNQSVEQGVFSDKGPDLIKEFNLRVREMPKATKEALNAIGLDSRAVAKEIDENGIGGAFRMVQKRLQTLKADSPAVGQALADIYGEAGESAGIQFIQTLDLTDASLNSLIDSGNEYTRQMIAQLEANEELAEAQNEVSKKFSETSGSLGIYVTQVKTFLFRVAGSILDFFSQLPATVAGVQSAFRQVMDNIRNFFERTYLRLQITYKQITKLNPFGKTSDQIDQEIAVLRGKMEELAGEAKSVAEAYNEAMLSELDRIEQRQKVAQALTPSVPEDKLRQGAKAQARRTIKAYDEELAKLRAERASQPGAVATLGATPLPSTVESTGEATEDTTAQEDILKNRFLQALITEQQYEDQRFALQQAAYERRLAFLREKYGEESAEFVKLENEKLENQRDYDEQRKELTKRTEDAKRQMTQEGFSAIEAATTGLIGLLGDEEGARKKNALALKAFSVGKVLIDTQEAVMAILKNSEANPSNILFPGSGRLIAGAKIAGVLTRSALAVGKIRGQGFYDGGYTGTNGLFRDTMGRKVVGAVHEREWVAPEWQTTHPVYGPVIGWLENMRKNGFQEGGFANANTALPSTPTLDLTFLQDTVDRMRQSQEEMTQALRQKRFGITTGQVRDALEEDYLLDEKSGF